MLGLSRIVRLGPARLFKLNAGACTSFRGLPQPRAFASARAKKEHEVASSSSVPPLDYQEDDHEVPAEEKSNASLKKIFSSYEMDLKLQKGIAMHAREGWAKVADYVGGGATALQCKNRSYYLKTTQKKRVGHGVWREEELALLEQLITTNVVAPRFNERTKLMTKEYINWKGISIELGRSPEECAARWRGLKSTKLKMGPFTPEEDALIAQRVAEVGDQRSGLWTSLQKVLGRSGRNIMSRWNYISKYKDGSSWFWTTDMDERLAEGVSLHKVEGWARVAAYVGGGVSRSQCMQRWNGYMRQMKQGTVQRGSWSEEELRTLRELVPHHIVAPYWSKNLRAMTQEYTNWAAVATKLQRLPTDCRDHWNALQTLSMRKGRFTVQEDAIIRQRVAEWLEKGKGPKLWVGLQKELNRPATNVQIRWTRWLSRKQDFGNSDVDSIDATSSVSDSDGDSNVSASTTTKAGVRKSLKDKIVYV